MILRELIEQNIRYIKLEVFSIHVVNVIWTGVNFHVISCGS